MSGSLGPTGLARRGRRLSDRETEQRMLRAALDMVHRAGLTVSLEHISFEEVIRDADVSRSAAYRRWPHKDLFFSDLVKELAAHAVPEVLGRELDLIRQVAAERDDWLDTPELRQGLVAELVRRLSLLDFDALYESPGWRTYLALHATFLSIADGELREQVRAALSESELEHTVRVARGWEHLVTLLGYRLRPGLGLTFEHVATLAGAAMRGLVLMALSVPGIAGQRVAARPFGAADQAEWSLPSIGLGALAWAFLEPDPAIKWDDERRATVREALAAPALPGS